MNMLERIRTWWQAHTGEEETPLDGDTPAWFLSLCFHLALMIILTLLVWKAPRFDEPFALVTAPVEEEITLPETFVFSDAVKPDIGANSVDGEDVAEGLSDVTFDFTEVNSVDDVAADVERPVGEVVYSPMPYNFATKSDPDLVVPGAAGVGVPETEGAVDRLTHAILNSLDERKTLVVWMFDQSGSLESQRNAIRERMDRIYEELNVIETAGDPRFANQDDKPLLSSVVAFGENVTLRTEQPTDILPIIKEAVAGIETDESGIERVFTAVRKAAEQYEPYTSAPDPRNVMLVVFTDEAGDDLKQELDQAVDTCRRHNMPVYVVGIPSPFGRKQVDVKWVDPDPNYDQTPQWAPVAHGPESLYPERLKLPFSGVDVHEEPLDSGFGPFGLTRLAVETGGMYFAIHPHRNLGRPVDRKETGHLSGYIRYFFSPAVMRRYQPEYVSVDKYKQHVQQNKAMTALVRASLLSWNSSPDDIKLTLKFPKKNEGDLKKRLTKSVQGTTRLLEDTLYKVYTELRQGEEDREKIVKPRWRAGFDLAMGRALATKVRLQSYNAMLANVAANAKFTDPKNDTWILTPADEYPELVGDLDLSADAAEARQYLQQVIDEHPGTPWALVAARELEVPFGWHWTETFTNVNPTKGDGTGVGAGGGGGGGGGGGAGAGTGVGKQPSHGGHKRPAVKRKPKRSPPKL